MAAPPRWDSTRCARSWRHGPSVLGESPGLLMRAKGRGHSSGAQKIVAVGNDGQWLEIVQEAVTVR